MNFLEVIGGPAIALIAIAGTIGWVVTTWLRVKHGYPLEGSWGQKLKPDRSSEALERIKLLTGENARISAELAAVKERLQVVERIVTDRGFSLSYEIDSLRH
ncbi:hypothetical protein [Sandaracinobacteroides saxicola]|uniref:Phage shock protein B n=1 Tax=Sandaracinobacteroides saxicola TaxID=2759707 RepID=A0A7G5ILY3_9SPHN|nr:hypothetical protein [Sandaracinobacteroides saxicola]QMW24375.1 hypothetical protein H3309_07970 [Sandaracinobacteroides saxicola]